MLSRSMLYDILYALAARDGREKALFGGCQPLAREAFERSLACNAFPDLWGERALLYCYPAFVKLCWRGGVPLDAKTYLIAGVQ